jgi:histidine triad (HIT) family protein
MNKNAACVFCKIIARELPATIITENDHALVIADIAPKAPIHYLAIPKKHIDDVYALAPSDTVVPCELLDIIRTTMKGQDFRLLVNNGPTVGQTVFHLHYHILAGQQFDF